MIETLIRQHLTGFPARSLLDVGPGYGDFSRVAAHVTGANKITFLDQDRAVLSWQADQCKKAGLQTTFLQLDLDTFIVSRLNEHYDLILCQEILEHLHEPERLLKALVNLLSPEGRIVVTVPTMRSERWLKWVNRSYMRDEPLGHVRQFNKKALLTLLHAAGLSPSVFIPTQPHYFISHTWLFGMRMKVAGATGRVITGGFRRLIFWQLSLWSKRFFMATDPTWWGRIVPRNYFVVAEKIQNGNSPRRARDATALDGYR